QPSRWHPVPEYPPLRHPRDPAEQGQKRPARYQHDCDERGKLLSDPVPVPLENDGEEGEGDPRHDRTHPARQGPAHLTAKAHPPYAFLSCFSTIAANRRAKRSSAFAFCSRICRAKTMCPSCASSMSAILSFVAAPIAAIAVWASWSVFTPIS